MQLFSRGIISASEEFHADTASRLSVDDDYGVDVGGSMFTSDHDGVVIPDVGFTPTDTQLDYIQEHFSPLQRSYYNGVCVLYKWKNHFSEMKGDVGMSLHEKEGEQEDA